MLNLFNYQHLSRSDEKDSEGSLMKDIDIKKRIKKQRLLGVLFAVFMLIMMLPYISHGRAGVIVYAADEKLEIVGNPTVYVQSGGQTVFSIQVKNISGAELKGVNYYQGFRSME